MTKKITKYIILSLTIFIVTYFAIAYIVNTLDPSEWGRPIRSVHASIWFMGSMALIPISFQ